MAKKTLLPVHPISSEFLVAKTWTLTSPLSSRWRMTHSQSFLHMLWTTILMKIQKLYSVRSLKICVITMTNRFMRVLRNLIHKVKFIIVLMPSVTIISLKTCPTTFVIRTRSWNRRNTSRIPLKSKFLKWFHTRKWTCSRRLSSLKRTFLFQVWKVIKMIKMIMEWKRFKKPKRMNHSLARILWRNRTSDASKVP